MNTLLGLGVIASFAFAGFAVFYRRPKPEPHDHLFEKLYELPYEVDELPDSESLQEAKYVFLICDCGSTVEMLLLTKLDGTMDGQAVFLSDWQELEL